MLVVFSCLNAKEAFPPDRVLLCQKPAYCCKYDQCNSDEIYRDKFPKVPRAATTGKSCAERVPLTADLSLFDVLLES